MKGLQILAKSVTMRLTEAVQPELVSHFGLKLKKISRTFLLKLIAGNSLDQ